MDFRLSKDKTILEEYKGNISHVIVPNSVTKISSGAFSGNNMIKTVTLPHTIDKIGRKAFEECQNLEYIEFSSIPEQCNGCSFCNCKNLRNTIIRGTSLVRVPQSTKGIFIIPEGISDIQEGAFCECKNITDLIIPESVTKISQLAFNGLINLKSIKIPSSVTFIEERAFTDCGKVESIIVDENNSKYDSRCNCNAIVEKKQIRLFLVAPIQYL